MYYFTTHDVFDSIGYILSRWERWETSVGVMASYGSFGAIQIGHPNGPSKLAIQIVLLSNRLHILMGNHKLVQVTLLCLLSERGILSNFYPYFLRLSQLQLRSPSTSDLSTVSCDSSRKGSLTRRRRLREDSAKGVSRGDACRECCIFENTKLKREEKKISPAQEVQ